MNNNKVKIVKTNRRTLALHISNTGELIVRAPLHCPNDLILNFIEEKKNWIKKKQDLVTQRLKTLSNNVLLPGNRIPFLGDFYKISINKDIKESVIFDNEFIFKSKSIIQSSMLDWYKREAKNIIPGITECKAFKFNLGFSKIKINSAKKRWGSCTSRKNINFSWRLVLLPEEIIHYIVIHELAHLKILNHSKKYWQLVEKLLPNYKVYEEWIKKNSYKYFVNL
jgi:predicted metal-dependent hydrolase